MSLKFWPKKFFLVIMINTPMIRSAQLICLSANRYHALQLSLGHMLGRKQAQWRLSSFNLTHLRQDGVFKRQEIMREAYIDQILATWHNDWRCGGGVGSCPIFVSTNRIVSSGCARPMGGGDVPVGKTTLC